MRRIESSGGTGDGPAASGAGGRRRLLIYAMNYAPEPTGCGRYTGQIGAYLAMRGHSVEVITAPPHYPGWVVGAGHCNRYTTATDGAGVRITRCPLLLRRRMFGLWRALAPLSFALTSLPVVLWRILRTRPDAVFLVEPTLFAAPAALLAARLVGARTVLHVQDLEIDAAFGMGHLKGGLARRLAARFERFVLKRVDRVITISRSMQRSLVRKGVLPGRLSIVRNWVDLDQISPLVAPSRYRDELELDADVFVVLYAGNIGAKQGLNVVLDAAEQLADDPRITLVIAGEGPAKRGLVARQLPNVHFLPVQPEERLCELLNLADLHVLPQERGAADLVLPSKIGGMLASGRPSVVMADEGTELAAFVSGAAHLVPAGDAAALVTRVREGQQASLPVLPRDPRDLAQELSGDRALRLIESLVCDQLLEQKRGK